MVHDTNGHGKSFPKTIAQMPAVVCPGFPEAPATVNWSIPDPAAEAASQDSYPAFVRTAEELNTRIQFLLYAIEYSQTSSERS